jgi:hypothetical protein
MPRKTFCSASTFCARSWLPQNSGAACAASSSSKRLDLAAKSKAVLQQGEASMGGLGLFLGFLERRHAAQDSAGAPET